LSSFDDKDSFSGTTSKANQSESKLPSRRLRSVSLQKTINAGVQSLYHGVSTTFQCHNDLTNNHGEKAFIISLLTIASWSKHHQN
jgi:hypothetical protein